MEGQKGISSGQKKAIDFKSYRCTRIGLLRIASKYAEGRIVEEEEL